MRVHIVLDDEVVGRVDELAGARGRSQFVERAIIDAVERAERHKNLLASFGSIPDAGHDWDPDPQAWVDGQRRTDPSRIG